MADRKKLYDSQQHMLSLAFSELSKHIKFDNAEIVADFDIQTPGTDGCYDLDLKFVAGTQSCNFSFMPAVNSLTHFWFFLEDIVMEHDTPSIYFADQEGPEAILYVQKHSDGNITFTVLSQGWYELIGQDSDQVKYKKVYNRDFSMIFNIKCDKKLFIQKMYKTFTEYQNNIPEDAYFYNDAQYKSSLLQAYLGENA